jgi:hypothetical protein
MRAFVPVCFFSFLLSLSLSTASVALPSLAGVEGSLQTNAPAPVVQARTFCYNRYTGLFKHWGACHTASHPRVYCRDHYTGEFLHWGSCRY